MKILLCHNHYQQAGGEDQVFADEAWLLESHGHDVVRYTQHNDAINELGRWDTLRRTIWSRQSYTDLRELIRRERPSVMHCTNTFPLISPAAYYAARAEGVAVVHTLHNYRTICPNGLLLRGGQICEDCVGKRIAWPGVLHGCYRNSRAASAVVAALNGTHWAMKTWNHAVNRYVALTEFSRGRLVAGGLPAEKVVVKPNFVHPDPGAGEGQGGYVVFVGRLSPEKGVELLLSAWERGGINWPLKIAGDGPLAQRVRQSATQAAGIEWLGRKSNAEVLSILGNAAALILPSECYENCPKTLIESFSKGTPAVVPRLGALAELVDDDRTGLHFEPGNADDLSAKVQQLLTHPRRLAQMRRAARLEYEQKFTAEHNYRILTTIYQQALADEVETRERVAKPAAGDGREASDASTAEVDAGRDHSLTPVNCK